MTPSNLKTLISDGHQYKAIDPWNPDDTPEAWTGTVPKEESKKLVPVVYAAWQMRCKAMADLPFSIYGKGETKIDDSDGYKNAVKFLKDPYQFFWKCEAALCGYGSFYFFNEHNKAVTTNLYYWRPDTVAAEFDKEKWLPKKFTRDNGAVKIDFTPEDVLYCWLPDPDVEVGPPNVWPLKAALLTAGSLDSINRFINDYAGRGMTKMFLLAMKGNPPPGEKEKIQSWWNSFWNKVKVRWMVFNADAITPTVIGDGLEALRGTEVTDGLQRQILSAMGVPASLVLADAATYATASQDARTLYQNTVMPDARIIQSALNTQILEKMGYHLEFEPERLETFQTDETERAGALGQLVTAGMPLPLAMGVLGYDLTEEQEAMLNPVETKPIETTDTANEAMNEDLVKFQRKALKHIGKDVAFESKEIPVGTLRSIRLALVNCKTEDDVRAAFATNSQTTSAPEFISDPAMLALADAIREATKAVNMTPVSAPMPTVKVFNNVPDPETWKPPDVIVNNPPAAVTNTTNVDMTPVAEAIDRLAQRVENKKDEPVDLALVVGAITGAGDKLAQAVSEMANAPAPKIEVKPEITVQAADVKLPRREKRKAKIVRDQSGIITGLEEQ